MLCSGKFHVLKCNLRSMKATPQLLSRIAIGLKTKQKQKRPSASLSKDQCYEKLKFFLSGLRYIFKKV